MKETKEQIADIVKDINFKRRPRVSKQKKTEHSALKQDIDAVSCKLDLLRLRLWHAEYKSDYHSLTMEEATQILNEARHCIDDILYKINQE